MFLISYKLICAHAYSILAYPVNSKSHILAFTKFAAALTERNHRVDILIPTNNELNFEIDASIGIIRYPTRFETCFIDDICAEAMETTPSGYFQTVNKALEGFAIFREYCQNECEDLLQNQELIRRLSERAYDLLILDNTCAICGAILPYKLNLPFIIFSTGGIYWYNRIPVLPSISPHLLLPLSEIMSFTQRFINLIVFCIAEYNIDNLIDDHSYSRKYVPEKQALTPSKILQEAMLYFYRHNDLMQFPLPKAQNIIHVSDLTVEDASPLPAEFESILGSTNNSVILFSIGTNLQDIPDDLARKLCSAFRMLPPSNIVILKAGPISNCSNNVIIKPWLPQNALLAHPKVKLFITHCGVKSYIESAYHGTPMIGLPIALDQKGNCAYMEHKGLGICMGHIGSFQSHELAENINIVLKNAQFLENAKNVSEIMHNQLLRDKEKVAFWIEHVVQFGSKHLKAPGYETNLFQFFMIDVVIAVTVLVTFVLFFTCLALRYIIQ